MRAWFVAAAIVVTGAWAAQAEPVATLADGRSGKIEFESITPTGFYPLTRHAPSPKTTITGVLSLPEGSAKVPAIVLAHGSGGVTDGREGRWSGRLNDLGVAAFIVDS